MTVPLKPTQQDLFLWDRTYLIFLQMRRQILHPAGFRAAWMNRGLDKNNINFKENLFDEQIYDKLHI